MAEMINDLKREQVTISKRFIYSSLIVLVAFALILSRYAYLQVKEYSKYKTLSENNRVHLNAIGPQRGRIYARDGVVLAENLPSFVVTVVRGRMRDVDKELEVLRKLLKLDKSTIAKFKKRLYQHRAYDMVPMRYELTEKERAILAVNRYKLPGVSVTLKLIRSYPFGSLTGHIIGYVGRISERDRKKLIEDGREEKYTGALYIGKTGLERYYEEELYGDLGFEQVETNAHGKVLRSLERTDPIPGQDLSLYLDLPTQRKATELLGGELGTVVAIDVRTGGVVAMVSMPNYDTNLFINGISYTDYNALRDSPDRPLFNRAIQGTYPPASTIKPFMALLGLQSEVTDTERTISDPGWYRIGGDKRKYRDWVRTGHGRWVNLAYAIKQSCDVYFYDLAYRLGIDRISPFLGAFGFGRETGVDLPHEGDGLNPSKEWKRSRYDRAWYPGDTVNIGIGQGFMLTTPLQLATATAILANRGGFVEPRFVKEIGGQPVESTYRESVTIKDEYWDEVIEAMEGVIHSPVGTARHVANLIDFKMAGKSGTAQVVGIKQNEKYDSEALAKRNRDHALFIGFAPVEEPKVAVAVIVENGESGGGTAGPIAAKVAAEYLNSLRREQRAQTSQLLETTLSGVAHDAAATATVESMAGGQ